jgi:hypothetical protein
VQEKKSRALSYVRDKIKWTRGGHVRWKSKNWISYAFTLPVPVDFIAIAHIVYLTYYWNTDPMSASQKARVDDDADFDDLDGTPRPSLSSSQLTNILYL